jgi:hypothetical protein
MFGIGQAAGVRMDVAFEWRIGNAGELTVDVRGAYMVADQSPQPGMDAHHEGDHGSDGAHRLNTKWGRVADPRTRPLGST